MSYRERLTKLPKKVQSDYEHLTIEELKEKINYQEDGYFKIPETVDMVILSYAVNQSDEFKPFFKKFDFLKDYGYRFDIIDKPLLKKIIEDHADEIYDYCNTKIERLKDENESLENKVNLCIFDLEMRKNRWKLDVGRRVLRPYRLIEDPSDVYKEDFDGHICVDDSIEYNLFNLVFIYNTFDWENNLLILNGW